MIVLQCCSVQIKLWNFLQVGEQQTRKLLEGGGGAGMCGCSILPNLPCLLVSSASQVISVSAIYPFLRREITKISHLLVFGMLSVSCEDILFQWGPIKYCISWAFSCSEFFFTIPLTELKVLGSWSQEMSLKVWWSQPQCLGCNYKTAHQCSPANSDYPVYLRIFISSTLA